MESNDQTPKFNVYDLGSVAKNLNRSITNKNGSVIKSTDPYNAGSVVRTKATNKKGR
jgi:hypothetical protein